MRYIYYGDTSWIVSCAVASNVTELNAICLIYPRCGDWIYQQYMVRTTALPLLQSLRMIEAVCTQNGLESNLLNGQNILMVIYSA